jgi:hypothetical protein
MSRGKRDCEIKFLSDPSVSIIAFILKAIKRHGWPTLLADKSDGEIKAQLVYEMGGCLHIYFKENLILQRNILSNVERGSSQRSTATRLAGSFRKADFLREIDAVEALQESKGFSLLATVDSQWSISILKTLKAGLMSNRFHAEALVFRLLWPRVIERAIENEKRIHLKQVFNSWIEEEGWKLGIKDRDYDALKNQCISEDRAVEKAYSLFGYSSYEQFLMSAPFEREKVTKLHRAILARIIARLEEIIQGPD